MLHIYSKHVVLSNMSMSNCPFFRLTSDNVRGADGWLKRIQRQTKHGLVYTIEKCAIGCAMGSLCYISFWNKTPACKNMKSCLYFGGLCAYVFLLRVKKTKDFESIHNLILQMATKNTSHGIGQQRQQTQNGSETLQLSYIHALFYWKAICHYQCHFFPLES
jgi:hypothetical protein